MARNEGGIMKLRNKKTGEMGQLVSKNWNEAIIVDKNGIQLAKYNSLAKLNEEWEDVPEEPKEHWYINEFGTPTKADFVGRETLYDKCRKDFGNYFETKEEAEKAVEKLKAWKRLKDKEFMFCGTDCINKNNVIYFEFGGRPLTQSEAYEAEREIDICFGGGE